MPILVAAWLAVGHARSPSHGHHDSAIPTPHSTDAFVSSPLPRPLSGLERISGRNAQAGVCRTGHGALPCRPGVRSLSKERGRPLSPFMTARRELEVGAGRSPTGGAAAAASRDWNARNSHVPSSSRGSPVHHTQVPRRELGASTPSPLSRSHRGPRAVRNGKTALAAATAQEYEILSESVLWESPYGAMAVYERTVRFPDHSPSGGDPDGDDDSDVPALAKKLDSSAEGKTVRWHIVGCPLGNFSSVVIFPYDSKTGTCSLIREYCPGIHDIKSGIPGGLYEERKHTDLLNAARDELNEEAGLMGGTWFALAPEGIPQDKYSRNRLHPYLVIDSSIDPNPRRQDDTEQIEVEHFVSLDEAKRRLLAGDMPAPAAMVTLMAIDKLRELGYVS